MSERKYNYVWRDREPKSYHITDPSKLSYQFYFRFVEPVNINGDEKAGIGVTVNAEDIDLIPEDESAYETAVAIRDYFRDHFLYNGRLKDMEAVVAYLEPHIERDHIAELEHDVERAREKLQQAEERLERATAAA